MEDIYYFRPELPKVDTDQVFNITEEHEKIRVKNKHVNCLYSNLTPFSFNQYYNLFNQHLNLDFNPIKIEDKIYTLNPNEQERLVQSIITNWIYFYTINNLPVQVDREDFLHPYTVDYVLQIIDPKYGENTKISLILGAKILRLSLTEFTKMVERRRVYYNR